MKPRPSPTLSILRLTAQRLQHQLRERAEADDPAVEALQILDDQASRIAQTTEAIIRNANTSLSRIDLRDVLDTSLIEASSWITTSLPSERSRRRCRPAPAPLWTPHQPPTTGRRSRFDSNAGNSIDRCRRQRSRTAAHAALQQKPSGSGLGLFIVRSAMEGHNLTLGAAAPPQTGLAPQNIADSAGSMAVDQLCCLEASVRQ